MIKAETAYRTITEVADLLQVQASVLRFWETQFHQIKPVKRMGGRRYYRAEDVVLLAQIRDLLYKEKFTIKGFKNACVRGWNQPMGHMCQPGWPNIRHKTNCCGNYPILRII